MESHKITRVKFVLIFLFLLQIQASTRSRSAQVIDLTQGTEKKETLKISFGSCYGLWDFNADIFQLIQDQPMSKTLQPASPDLFVWLGDVAYIDSTEFLFRLMPLDYVNKRFADTLSAKGYNKLKRVVGIWDDHDYGQNDAGKEMLDRDRNREIFLDFIDEPQTSERRTQKGTAIFQDYYIQTDVHLVHLILLDNRYDYDKATNDRLGDLQWQWLDDILLEGKQKNVTQTVLGAGIQIMIQRKGKLMETFQWPTKKRILDLLKHHQLSNVIFISGDVHFAQIYENKCRALTGAKLVEITSSGLSHSQKDFIPYANLTVNTVTPHFFSTSEPYVELNFGNIIIDRNSKVTLEVRNRWGSVILEQVLTPEDLKFDEKSLRFSKQFCEVKLGHQIWFMYFEHIADLWLKLDPNSLGWLFCVIPLLVGGIASVVFTLVQAIIWCFFKCLPTK